MVLVDIGQLGFQFGHALSQLLRRRFGGGFGVGLRLGRFGLGFLLREFGFGVLVLLLLMMRHKNSFERGLLPCQMGRGSRFSS